MSLWPGFFDTHRACVARRSVAVVLAAFVAWSLSGPADGDPGARGSNEAQQARLHRQLTFKKGHGVMIAVVAPLPSEKLHSVLVTEIDGRHALDFQCLRAHACMELERLTGRVCHDCRIVAIPPGNHEIALTYLSDADVEYCADWWWCSGGFRHVNIDFVAEPGKEYTPFALFEDGREWVWVEDADSGEVVAGENP